MRARNNNHSALRTGARWLLALVAVLTVASGWAQDNAAEEGAVDRPATVPVPPEPPKPPEPPEVSKQVRITRGEDGTLRIRTSDEHGKRTDVQVDLGEKFGGALTRRIYSELESKGILDERGLVVERAVDDALEDVPRNIDIGIKGDLDFDHPHGQSFHMGGDSVDFSWIVPVIAILAVFGTPILIVWLVTRSSYRKKQLMMDNINRMVAEGRDIPPELLDAMEGASPSNMRDRGFTLIAVGLALFIWLSLSSGVEVGSLGLIPLFIGVARFINWKLDHQQGIQAG
ncbi:DUF6249 domain-containing protein [Microbulbifer hainanensis]|uniref:DUF6249 domain-containing protein n=1 Tax=Microbulbifer hainanensis TaxID=2735675 RepID=UPI001867557A|nr:DUF6249 domain-containing protein [Microbulbifer hainanensis]